MPKTIPQCHPNRPHLARGLCGPCYRRSDFIRDRRKTHYGKNRISISKQRRAHRKPHKAAFQAKDKARYPIAGRANWLRRKYGITSEQYDKMFVRQNGRCAICPNKLYPPGDPSGHRAAPVDHDHKTNRVRGLACYVCNRLRIGKHTAESAKKLFDYLSSDFDGRTI